MTQIHSSSSLVFSAQPFTACSSDAAHNILLRFMDSPLPPFIFLFIALPPPSFSHFPHCQFQDRLGWRVAGAAPGKSIKSVPASPHRVPQCFSPHWGMYNTTYKINSIQD